MKKTLLVLLAIVCLITPIFAQGSTEAASEAPATAKEITVWSWDPNYNIPAMEEAASRYEAKHPGITINVVSDLAKADVEQKIQTILSSGSTDGLPDICLVEDYNVQKYITYYPGQFADLTDDFDYSQFTDYKTGMGVVNGKNYTLPFDAGVTGLFYRTDLMAKAGITADDLNNITWNQFVDLAAKYKKATGNYMFSGDPTDGGAFRVMLQSSGSWYFDKTGTKPNIIGNEALAAALKLYKRMYNEDLRLPTSGWTPWVESFNSGKVASVCTGLWIMGSIKAAPDQSGKWAVAPTPRLDVAGSVNASNLGGSSWMVLQNAPGRDTAIDFLQETFGSDVDFYQQILKNQGAMGSYIPSLTGSAYSENDKFFSNTPIFETMAKWSQEIPIVNVGLFTYDADSAVMSNIQDYYDSKATLDETLVKIDAQLRNSME